MIELELDNVTTHVFGPADTLQRISELLSYEQPGADHIKRNMAPWSNWDGRVRLMKVSGESGNFPAGLTQFVISWAQQNDIEVSVQDGREVPDSTAAMELVEKLTPRPYQDEIREVCAKNDRGIILVGTGGGKTITSLMMTLDKKVPTLFVTPDVGLRKQTFKTYKNFLGDLVSEDINSLCPVVIGNIQTLAKKQPKFFDRFRMLILDEFHHSAAKSYLKLNKMTAKAYYRYGLTGTNVRTDGKDMQMHGVLSDVLYAKTTSDLITDGWLVPPHITILRLELKGWSRMNYRDAYEKITMHDPLNLMISSIAKTKSLTENKQTLILVRRKEHGAIIERLLDGHAVYLSGDDKYDHREQVKQKFLRREVKCLIATDIFGEGQDIPSIDCLINARFNQSEIQTKQGIGRALRLAEGAKNYDESVQLGKGHAEVFDFLPIGQRHLSNHAADRIRQYRSEPAFKIRIERA